MSRPPDRDADDTTTASSTPTTLDRSLPVVAAAIVVALGAVRVDDRAYWMDEGATRFIAVQSFQGLRDQLLYREAGMGPYYGALWLWRHALDSDAGLRWFSVVGGAVAAALLVAVVGRWFGRTAAVASGVVLIANPFFLRYLTEARAYTWVMAVSIAFIAALRPALERPSIARTVWVGALAGVGVALHTVFVLWVIAVVGAAAVAGAVRRVHVRHVVVAAAVAALCVLPFVPAMVRRRDQIDWIEPTTARVSAVVTRDLLGGWVLVVAILVGVVACVVDAVVRVRHERTDAELPLVLVLGAAVGGSVLLVLASFVKPLLLARYFAPAFPFLCVAAVLGWGVLGRSLARVRAAEVVVVAGVVTSLVVFVASNPSTDEERPEDPRAAVAYVASRFGDGDVVIVDRVGQRVVNQYLERSQLDAIIARDEGVDPTELVSAPTVFVIGWAGGSGLAWSDGTNAVLRDRTVERVDFGLAVLLVAER